MRNLKLPQRTAIALLFACCNVGCDRTDEGVSEQYEGAGIVFEIPTESSSPVAGQKYMIYEAPQFRAETDGRRLTVDGINYGALRSGDIVNFDSWPNVKVNGEIRSPALPDAPEERRRWIEALHEQQHGKSVLSEKHSVIWSALGDRLDKEFVIKTLTSVLGTVPVIRGDTYWFEQVQVCFDYDDNLRSMSESSGGSVVIASSEDCAGGT